MKDKRFHIIFAVILVMLLLPAVLEIGHFNCWELNGYTEPIQPVKLTYANYRNFKFQDYCKKKGRRATSRRGCSGHLVQQLALAHLLV